jgi:hypothetical protein
MPQALTRKTSIPGRAVGLSISVMRSFSPAPWNTAAFIVVSLVYYRGKDTLTIARCIVL